MSGEHLKIARSVVVGGLASALLETIDDRQELHAGPNDYDAGRF